jgi:curved DNA-binding protein
MAQPDFYQVLGVQRTASSKEIQSAYRRLARKFHPDVTGGDQEAEERFKAVNEAHDVLSDQKKRPAYDKWGDQWEHAEQLEQMHHQRGGFGGRAGPGGGAFEFDFSNQGAQQQAFGDSGGGGSVFDRLFRSGEPAGPRRGQDIEHRVPVSLTEAFQGTTRRVQVRSIEGGRPTGKQLEVTIPAGVETGSKIRLRGKGGQGSGGGQSGDVVLTVEVAEDARFERKAASLHADLPVPLTTAVLGGEVEVPTLNGVVMLRVPEGTQNGRVFRLGNKGMPVLNSDQRGDLFAKVRVVLPEQLSDEERELFRQLDALRRGPVETPAVLTDDGTKHEDSSKNEDDA